MRNVILGHSMWSGPAVIEGWQFDPPQITKMDLANVRSVWLNPDRETLEARIRGDANFYRGARDGETMISHYVDRGLRRSEQMSQAAREFDLPVLPLTVQTTPEDLEALVISVMDGVIAVASPRRSKPAHPS